MTAPAETSARTASTPTTAPRTLRRLVLGVQVLFLVMMGLAICVGSHETSPQRLTDDLASGTVDTVEVATRLWPDTSTMEKASGCAPAEVTWRRWGLKHSTTINQPLGSTPPSECTQAGSSSAVASTNITEYLRGVDPDVRVVRTEPSSGTFSYFVWTIPAETVPPPLGVVAVAVALLAMLAPLTLALVGPEPRHATRWAWFWLMCSPWAPWTTMAYLFIGTRGAQPGRRRLTGGWAFLLGVLLGAASS